MLLAGEASVFNCTHLSTGIVSTSMNRPELIAAPHVPSMQAVALRYKEREGERPAQCDFAFLIDSSELKTLWPSDHICTCSFY